MKWRWVAVLAAVGTVVWVAAAATVVGGIDINAEGTLKEIRTILKEEHGLSVSVEGDLDEDTHVELHLENASPTQVVREICRQVGAVYRAWTPMEEYLLSKGDIGLDPRPRVKVGEYTVFLREVELEARRAIGFRVGAQEGVPSEYRRLKILFDLEAESGEAAARLYGVWPQASVVTDSGERLVNEAGVARSHPVHVLGPRGPATQYGLRFPGPSGSPKRVTKLNGVLALYKELTQAACEFERHEVGSTKQLGEIGCKLTGWDRLRDDVSVSFDMPAGRGSLEQFSVEVRSFLLAPDGERVRASGRGAHLDGKTYEYTDRFRDVSLDVDNLIIEATFRWGPLEFLDFTMEDIPLP